MNEIIAALKAALVAAGLRVYDTAVPSGTTVQYPYVLLWSSAGRMTSVSVCDSRSVLDDTVGVTAVGVLADQVRLTARKARTALDGLEPGVIAGRHVDEVRLFDSRPIAVDRDFPLVGGSYPMTGVDIYRVSSTPA